MGKIRKKDSFYQISIVALVTIVAISVLLTTIFDNQLKKNLAGQSSADNIQLNPVQTPSQNWDMGEQVSLQSSAIGMAGTQGTINSVTSLYCDTADPECADNPRDGCDVRDKDFILTQNYNFPNGIDVCNNNRVIDCQGYSLTGTGVLNSKGIEIGNLSSGFNNATIRNCVIEEYYYGIYIFEPSSSNNIHNNTVRGTLLGAMQLWGVSDSRIHDNNINTTNSLQFGIGTAGKNNHIYSNTIEGRGGGIAINGYHNKVYQNTVRRLTSHGISISDRGGKGNIDGNEIYNNLLEENRVGIHLDEDAGGLRRTIIRNNRIYGGSWIGIQIGGLRGGFVNADIYENIIQGYRYGMILGANGPGSQHPVINHKIYANTLRGLGTTGIPGTIGIGISKAQNNQILQNTIQGYETGIQLLGELNEQTRFNTITDNTLQNNIQGILVDNTRQGTLLDNTILRNTITNNEDYGIHLLETSNINIQNNQVCYNGDTCDDGDFHTINPGPVTGDNNQCDRPHKWNDIGTTGCTTFCNPPTDIPPCRTTQEGCGNSLDCTPCPECSTCVDYQLGGCGGKCVPMTVEECKESSPI